MADSYVIKIENVVKRFGNFTAVSDFSLHLVEGEFFSLLGPSGCGKTTAMRMIAGFESPSEGRIEVDGQDMAGIPANKRPTNMVFQNYAIFPHLNVEDNIGYGLRYRGIAKADIAQRVSNALEMVELSGLQNRKATELSGGQRQRVALARALILQPKVLLLDEPLSALDRKLREQMQFEMRHLQKRMGITFVMVTHDQYEAMTMSDRIGVMFDGKLVQVASPTELYAKPCNKQVASFIGEMNFIPAEIKDEIDSKIEVTVAGIGNLKIEKNNNAQNLGSSCLLGIRPEQIAISNNKPENQEIKLEGSIRDIAFYGENIHYHVRVKELDQMIAVSVPNYFHRVDFKIDEKIWLGFLTTFIIDLGGS